MPTIKGTTGDESLAGSPESDRLFGLDGNDELFGGAGNDVLEGGVGFDTLTGGTGYDQYRFDIVDGCRNVVTDLDVIENEKVYVSIEATGAQLAGFSTGDYDGDGQADDRMAQVYGYPPGGGSGAVFTEIVVLNIAPSYDFFIFD